MDLLAYTRRNTAKKPAQRSRRPAVEGLELRQLLAIGITDYPIPYTGVASSEPWLLTTGGDGNLYFANFPHSIGVFNPTTHNTVQIPIPDTVAAIEAITNDTNGNIWFVEQSNPSRVAEYDVTTHSFTEYTLPTADLVITDLAVDGNGNVWLSLTGTQQFGELDPATDAFTTYHLPTTPTSSLDPWAVTRGPNGNLWFTTDSNYIGEIVPTTHTLSAYSAMVQDTWGITEGPDGNIWYTGAGGFNLGNIGTINPITHAITTVQFDNNQFATTSIATGPGNNLSFDFENNDDTTIAGQIGVIDPVTKAITTTTIPSTSGAPASMTTGPDGNAWFLDVVGAKIGQIRTVPDTTTVLTATPNPAIVDQTITLTTTIVPASGPGSPTGIVTFLDGSTVLGTANVSSSDQATLTTSLVAIGQHAITAEYSGDSNFGASTSSPLTEVIQGIPTTTQVSVIPNPGTFLQPITLIANITSASALPINTGSVNFFDNGSLITTVSVANGLAELTVPDLNVGEHSISAQYVNDVTDFASSQSSTVSETILPAQSTTELQASPNPGRTGYPITFTASVSGPTQPGIPFLNGTVTFFDGKTPIGSVSIANSTQASLTVTNLSTGTHLITAQFGGDQNHFGSTSNVVVEQVLSLTDTTTTLYPLSNPTPFGQPLILTATVAPISGSGIPTGTVTFFASSFGALGTANVNSSGVAILTISQLPFGPPLPIGLFSLTADYSGDGAFASSQSNTVTEYIGPPDGPRITSVERFGVHNAPTTLLLTFDEALHPATAEDVKNYVIVGPGGRRILVRAAVYNPITDTVAIAPRSRLGVHESYRLTVVGTGPSGVTDADGRLLDGADTGQPGSNFATILSRANLVIAKPVPHGPATPKVAHPTAKHAAPRHPRR
jgi:hypothetical protein